MKVRFTSFSLTCCLLLVSSLSMAQGMLSGRILDKENRRPLTGASVVIKGTENGTTTDLQGRFELYTAAENGALEIEFIGYKARRIRFSTSGRGRDLGNITLSLNTSSLKELTVVGRGVIDVADERKTPVAVSTIKASQIAQAAVNRQFPELLAETPSIQVNAGGGGQGDAHIYVRGFDQINTAVLINGQPVNGMEDGKVYWSNWDGIRDVASSIQVQRGLGASKLAISSAGGSINIVTKATEKKQGGFVRYDIGNDKLHKMTASYSSGLNKKGWGFSTLIARSQGAGYIEGTPFLSYSYFLSAGYKPNAKQQFNFMIFGAGQKHDHNYRTQSIATLLKYGRRHNSSYGYLKGHYLSEIQNFYNKPVANLNWDWQIHEKLKLSTVLYASWGRGGGTGGYAGNKVYPVRDTKTGHIDWDATYKRNRAIDPTQLNDKSLIVGSKKSGAYLIRNSVNNHNWYGLLSSLNYEHGHWSLSGGTDLRTYTGYHFRSINNLMGLDGWHEADYPGRPGGFNVFDTYGSSPFDTNVKTTDRIAFDYKERISYGGLFGQGEYSDDMFSAFIQAAGSNQGNVRWDYGNYPPSDKRKSDYVTNWGYNVKGGLNVKLTAQHSVFANLGYYSRQPFQDDIFLNYKNDLNPLTRNQSITGMELGYRYNNRLIKISLNLYNTIWDHRNITKVSRSPQAVQFEDGSKSSVYIVTNQSGLKETHRGAELNLKAYPVEGLIATGFFSYGDWKYDKNVQNKTFDDNFKPVKPLDNDGQVIDDSTLYLKGKKVPNAAQLTFGMGLNYDLFKGLHAMLSWKYNGDIYADYEPSDFLGAANKDKKQIKLPDYNLFNTGLYYTWELGDGKSLNFQVNVDNLFDTDYFSKMSTNKPVGTTTDQTVNTYKGVDVGNKVYWGLGRTWGAGVAFHF